MVEQVNSRGLGSRVCTECSLLHESLTSLLRILSLTYEILHNLAPSPYRTEQLEGRHSLKLPDWRPYPVSKRQRQEPKFALTNKQAQERVRQERERALQLLLEFLLDGFFLSAAVHLPNYISSQENECKDHNSNLRGSQAILFTPFLPDLQAGR